ncbi:MOSC N-terminal beta barrel domain-containing protein [Halorarum halophilum]|uniref:MOSC N-terminal beta barrel domain-containing protein n=1 Tax=Halorarum halophilum TaxID=2743090 RepID=A0A7D5L2N0_9EURY|nr:MOSC N-terminal beta barrel domain-containing protein [Halobaculum halophilum]QLG26923.1 MOSC N-terminal beta barrel domain-containing protein [Halobaculum halophilum]
MTDSVTLDRIRVFPVKSLDGVDVDAARIGPGGLDPDREFAVLDADGEYVNGKREREIHRVRAEFDLDARLVGLAAPGMDDATFHLDDDRAAMADWLGEFLGYEVSLVAERPGGYPDDTEAHGPTVISTGTLGEVASWYDGITVEGMRRRLRANLELAVPEPFAEDRLFTSRGERVGFRVGDARLEGVNPCQRCVVPSRDPDTGEEYPGFRERFVEKRRATMPEWSGGDWFDHDFRLMVNTAVPADAHGEELRVGDPVEVLEAVEAGE